MVVHGIKLIHSNVLQAKREQAKKDGTLLTKKQKEEKAAAELRKQALLKSGVQIEGLQALSSGAPANKKVVYGNRKKQGPGGGGSSAQSSPMPTSRPLSPEPTPEPTTPELTSAPTTAAKGETLQTTDDIKSDWDASSGDEGKDPVDGSVKDSWDASSDDEGEKPAQVTKPVQKSTDFFCFCPSHGRTNMLGPKRMAMQIRKRSQSN
jgi:translation initiation factor 5B